MSDIIAEVLSRGWMFNNCYQREDGTWRINLRRPDGEGNWFTDWAEGEDFTETVEDCLSKLNDATFEHDHVPSAYAEPTFDLSLALKSLTPTRTIRRR